MLILSRKRASASKCARASDSCGDLFFLVRVGYTYIYLLLLQCLSLSLSLALPERRGRLNFDGNELFDFTGLRWLPPGRSFFFLKVSSRGFGFRFLGIGSGEAAGAVRKRERGL